MASVWIIEQGEYSDYRVVGVFSSRESAQVVLSAITKPDDDGYVSDRDATIAEWPLDPGVSELVAGLSIWDVLMLRDGTVEKCQQVVNPSARDLDIETRIWRRSTAPAYRGTGKADVLVTNVWAESQEHAIKVANERRVQFIASGEWDSAKV